MSEVPLHRRRCWAEARFPSRQQRAVHSPRCSERRSPHTLLSEHFVFFFTLVTGPRRSLNLKLSMTLTQVLSGGAFSLPAAARRATLNLEP